MVNFPMAGNETVTECSRTFLIHLSLITYVADLAKKFTVLKSDVQIGFLPKILLQRETFLQNAQIQNNNSLRTRHLLKKFEDAGSKSAFEDYWSSLLRHLLLPVFENFICNGIDP